MKYKRGLVLSPGLEFQDPDKQAARVARGGDVCLCSACIRAIPISPQELRSYLLFWDALDYPGHRAGILEHNPEELFLIETGIMDRTKIQGFPADPTMLFSEVQMTAYRVRDKKEPGVWAFGRHSGRESLFEYDAEQKRAILVRLHNCIPVPDKEVPLDDILTFKEKRRDELLALRHHLDGIYQRIIAAGDGPLALSTEVSLLEQAMINHKSVAKERKLSLRLGSLEVKLTMDVDLTRAATVGTIAYSAGLGAFAATLVGAAAGANPKLELSTGASIKGIEKSNTPFEYVTSYHRDLLT